MIYVYIEYKTLYVYTYMYKSKDECVSYMQP